MPSKNCPLCGDFMEQRPSVKYKCAWKCEDCGLYMYDRSVIDSRFRQGGNYVSESADWERNHALREPV